jgi:hypothetical protein
VIRLRILFIFFCILQGLNASTQFSVATDGSLLRNLSSQQKFWAFGQTVQLNFYPSADGKNAIYTWVSYYTTGKFKNNFTASAKDAVTNPQLIQYTAHTDLRYRHLSVGWKHYLIGAYNSENIWNVYGYAGFGLLLGKASNSFNKPVDSAVYIIQQPLEGSSAFKRLTFDAGLGTEFPLGTAVFVYTEARTWIPTSHYPSRYLYNDNYHIPAILAINVGLRVLIE